MSENYFQSALFGKQIDDAISRIVSGEFDKLADDAKLAGASAQKSKTEAENAAQRAEAARDAVVIDEAKLAQAVDSAAQSEKKAELYANQTEAAAGGGVTSFNGRGGHVMPQAGDYTADMVGAVNPNLLRNWYFGDPVNQRGVTDGSVTNAYCIDGWKILNIGRLTINDKSITITADQGYDSYFRQIFDFAVQFPCTLSLLTNTGLIAQTFTGYNRFSLDGGGYIEISSDGYVSVFIPQSTAMEIAAAKLELGTVQTLAHQDESGAWVLNEIPDKTEELLRCCMSTADPTDDYANNKKTAVAVNALALDGSNAMTGALQMKGSGAVTQISTNEAGTAIETFKDGTYNTDRRWLSLLNSDQRPSDANALRLYSLKGGVSANYDILHTGNKPSGTYTGNGSAASRTINVGGIGGVVLIRHSGGMALVGPTGGFGNLYGSTEVSAGAMYFSNGIITLQSSSALVNTNGVTYYYQVL